MKQPNKQCPQCGKHFHVKPSHLDKSVYCSRSCMSAAFKVRMGGQNNPNYSNAAEKICEHCGKTFSSYSKTARFCSQSCAAKVTQTHEKLVRMASMPKPKPVIVPREHHCIDCGAIVPKRRMRCEQCKTYGTKSLRVCVVCGRGFKSVKYKKTCSVECLNKHKSIRQQGEQSHLWQGGKTDETRKARNSSTYDQWRVAVFKRDDYTCQMCNCRGGKLAAHHIKTFSKNRHIALELWNGITLCWSCHRSIKGKEPQYEQQFYQHTQGQAAIVRTVEGALEVVGL